MKNIIRKIEVSCLQSSSNDGTLELLGTASPLLGNILLKTLLVLPGVTEDCENQAESSFSKYSRNYTQLYQVLEARRRPRLASGTMSCINLPLTKVSGSEQGVQDAPPGHTSSSWYLWYRSKPSNQTMGRVNQPKSADVNLPAVEHGPGDLPRVPLQHMGLTWQGQYCFPAYEPDILRYILKHSPCGCGKTGTCSSCHQP